MTPEDRLVSWKLHNSMRGYFGFALYKAMAVNKDIILLTGDLGYGLFDNHKDDFGNRFINCGASEQSMLDIACGLALGGKIPVVYSITPFLIYRGFETLRTYVNHESIPIKLVGGGRDDDYKHDGFSHDATDVKEYLDKLTNIEQYWPKDTTDIDDITDKFLKSINPSFISLRR